MLLINVVYKIRVLVFNVLMFKKYFKVNNVIENINFFCVDFYLKNNVKDSFNIVLMVVWK